MPKAELHLHLEGTLEPELKFELAARNGVALPYALGRGDARRLRLRRPRVVPRRLLRGHERAAAPSRTSTTSRWRTSARRASQNVVYAEMFFDPQAHTSRGVPFATVIEGFRRAQRDAAGALGLRSQLIMCFLRDLSAESAMETLEEALPYRDWIVGVGLDSDERGNPPVKFARGVRPRARRGAPPDDALRRRPGGLGRAHLAVPRRDRGRADRPRRRTALEDPALVARDRRTRPRPDRAARSRTATSPAASRRARSSACSTAGMRATVNSDDPAYFPGYVNENLLAARARRRADRATRSCSSRATRSRSAGSRRTTGPPYLDRLEAYAAQAD